MQTFTPKGNIVGPILPQFILDRPISSGAKILYALLCNYAAKKDHCWPTQPRLAERLSCSVSSVKNYLRELVDEKLIAIVREQHRSSVYYMLRPVEFSAAPSDGSTAQTQGAQVNFQSTQSNIDTTQPNFTRKEANFGYVNNLKINKEIPPPVPPNGLETHKHSCTPPKASLANRAGGTFSLSLVQEFEKAWELYDLNTRGRREKPLPKPHGSNCTKADDFPFSP